MSILTKKSAIVFFSVAATVLGAYLIGSVFFSAPDTSQYEFVLAELKNLTQEVDVTGKVKAAQDIELAFEKSGKVAKVLVEVGEAVSKGQKLAWLEHSDLNSQLLEAQANLEQEEARLNELLAGTRPEEIKLARTRPCKEKPTCRIWPK